MPSESAKVVLIHDPFPLLAQGMWAALQGQPDLAPGVAERVDPSTLVPIAVEAEADVVVLGIASDSTEWLKGCAKLRRRRPRARVLLAVDPSAQIDMADVVRAGVIGVILRAATGEELLSAVRSALAGRNVIAASAGEQLMHALAVSLAGSDARAAVGALSGREIEVLRLVAEGLTNRDIGVRLHISENTVKNHLRRVHEKLGVRSRTEAVVSASREGLLALAVPPKD